MGQDKTNTTRTNDKNKNHKIIKPSNINELEEKDNNSGNAREEKSKKLESELKRKVLIIGDEGGKNCAITLRKVMDEGKYAVESFIKPGANLYEISKTIFSATIDYGLNDHVLLMFNVNNTNLKTINNCLKYIINVGKYTNLILSIEYDSNLKNQIEARNKIYCYIQDFGNQNLNVSVRVIDNVKYRKIFRHTKLSLCKCFKMYILTKVSLKTNIVIRNIPITKHYLEKSLTEGTDNIDLTKETQKIIDVSENNNFLELTPIRNNLR